MISRIKKGHTLGTINPLVDIYNVTCLKNLVTCGGEDMDKIEKEVNKSNDLSGNTGETVGKFKVSNKRDSNGVPLERKW